MTSTLYKLVCSTIGLALALLFAACQSDCRVTGTVSQLADGDTLLLTTDLASNSPTDTLIVADGQFQWQTPADTALLCRLWAASSPLCGVTFFIERGRVTITIDSTCSVVSGTLLNEEWQALNDLTVSYSQRINRTVSCLLSAGTPPSIINRRVAALYEELQRHIDATAEHNKDNELGRYIRAHYLH